MEEKAIITATFSSTYSKDSFLIMSMKWRYLKHQNNSTANTSKSEDVCCEWAAYSKKQSW